MSLFDEIYDFARERHEAQLAGARHDHGDAPDYEPATEIGETDSLGVCIHGESGTDCDVCSYSRAIDAYDAGCFDE